ncbi:Ubiquitin carboxyl-terminal hydrolase 47 [Xenoophorus captivus]|uniref:Ubiquitin carboxyl-terminal hydrolase 47 n=1 Tax=Xenoophorus captivus TaxID=1517983 RepID=A0ABV0QXA4_9TELE
MTVRQSKEEVVPQLKEQCKLDLSIDRDSREEPLELSEDERNELMKKESSRLLKTGHRVSYSPRKEKALKIYLDGGPVRDPGQD